MRASRQAHRTQICDRGHSASRAPSNREGFAKRNGTAETLKGSGAWWRQADKPGGGGEWRLMAWWSPPSGDGAVMMLQACGAWRCVMPARRFGPSVHLAMWDAC